MFATVHPKPQAGSKNDQADLFFEIEGVALVRWLTMTSETRYRTSPGQTKTDQKNYLLKFRKSYLINHRSTPKQPVDSEDFRRRSPAGK